MAERGAAGRKRLLVLGAGPAQLGVLEAARARNLDVVVADRDPDAVGLPLADRAAAVSTEDEQAIERLARHERVDGVLAAGSDWPVRIAASVAALLGVPHPLSPDAARVATSKRAQRDRFLAAGVPQPRFEIVHSPDDVTIGLPCVVKAPDRQGQRGLGVVRERSELAPAVERALEASRSGECLAEELVEGPELTVNAFSVGGRFHALTVTDRLTAEPPGFGVALAHVWPSNLPARKVGDVVAAARGAAAAVGITDGPSYTQIVVGRDGPRVVELAARLGGGHDAELCRAALGVDLNRLALAGALGEHVEGGALQPEPRVGGACVRFLVARPGLLRAVSGAEAASALEHVEWVRVYRRPGDEIKTLTTGADRAGAILARGPTREEALAHAGEAASLVSFETSRAEALA